MECFDDIPMLYYKSLLRVEALFDGSGAKPWLPEQMAWHEEKREASSGFISPPHSGL